MASQLSAVPMERRRRASAAAGLIAALLLAVGLLPWVGPAPGVLRLLATIALVAAAPDDEVHAFVNDLTRPAGTHLLGRRMYEVLQAWDAVPTDDGPRVIRDFATMWQASDRIVYSTTLHTVSSPRTRLESRFDPDAVRELKASADRDLTVG